MNPPRKDDEKVTAEALYGFAFARPEWGVRIVEAPGPRNAWEAAWWAFLVLWQEVIVPAALFALAFTAFKYALFA